MTTTVNDDNLVSIPADIAREFGIHPGTLLECSKTGEGTLTVKALPSRGELARQLLGAGRRWLKGGTDPIDDLIREREKDDQLDQADLRR
jgi:AbrB family looped-hinge helix DNA binding protein